MTASPEFMEYLLDSLGPLGGVEAKRLFGGAGLYYDGIMFAMVMRDELYLKTDDETIGAFEGEELVPFSYNTKNGRRSLRTYFRAPDAALDDPETLAEWASGARDAALRAKG